MWFVGQVGELSTALREGDKKELANEFANVLAWLMTLASISGVEMETAIHKYTDGRPSYYKTPCGCGNPKP